MKICVPVIKDSGMDSFVYNHFGSAPMFLMYDAESKEAQILNNRDQEHAHGQCNPVGSLQDNQTDVVLVGGIGGRAIQRLQTMNIKVYKATARTAQENIELFLENGLDELGADHSCSHHDNGHACH